MKSIQKHVPIILIGAMIAAVVFFAIQQKDIPSIRSEKDYIAGMVTQYNDMLAATKTIAGSTADPYTKKTADQFIVIQTNEVAQMHMWLQNLHKTTYSAIPSSYKTKIDVYEINDAAWAETMLKHTKIVVEMSKTVLKKSPHVEIQDFAKHIISTEKDRSAMLTKIR